MNNNHLYLPISDVIKSVSITHKFDKPKLIFLNTSDVESGKIINKKYFKISDLKGQAKKTIRKDDILFSEIRPKNKRYAYVDFDDTDDYVVSTKLMVLRKFNNKVDNKYLYYFLTSEKMLSVLQSRAENRIGSFPQITFDLLSEYHIRVPELRDQQKISGLLSDIDLKIELNNKINSELEALAKLIYDYWFVQFDFPDQNGKPYKSNGGKMVWSEELKRMIPEGWNAGGFDDIGDVVGGSTPSRSNNEYFTQNGIAWITPKDLSLNLGKKFISKGETDVTDLGVKKASLNLLPKGTVLLSSRAPIGYMAISRNEVTTNQGFKSIIPKDQFSTAYVFYTVQLYINAMVQYASGSTFSEISASTLKMIRIPIPDNKLIQDFTERVENILAQQDILEQENEQLEQLRDWLLPMLMNGQVKVKEN